MRGIAGDVTDALLSPDGSRVVYRADQDELGVVELFLSHATRPHRRAP